MPIPRRRFLAATCFAGLLAAAISAQVQTLRPAAAPPAWTGKPALVSFIGARSAEKVRGVTRQTDQKAWEEVWRRNLGDAPTTDGPGAIAAPEVDFTTCMTVAIFDGQTVNSNGLYVVGIEEDDRRVLIRYDSRSFQTLSVRGPDMGEACTPYGLFVIPRSAKALVIEENTQNLIGHPPVWTERARFDGV